MSIQKREGKEKRIKEANIEQKQRRENEIKVKINYLLSFSFCEVVMDK